MTDTDDHRLELLERQLAERVTERVRRSLFRLYATAGLAVIAALGFVGWDIANRIDAAVDDIQSDIKSQIVADIEAEIGDKRDEIRERATETRVMARRANAVIRRLQDQLDEFQPQADNLEDTVAKVNTLNVTSQDLIATYNQEFQPLVDTVDSLSNQLKTLAEQVNELNKIAAESGVGTNATPDKTPQQRSAAIQSVISGTQQAQQRYDQARDKATVFFQFAGGSREQAKSLSASLKTKGYVVPGEDRESSAAGRAEVRYFHEQDQAAAEQLARDTNQALLDLGYVNRGSKDVSAKSLVTYRGKKPRLGVLELWLEISF